MDLIKELAEQLANVAQTTVDYTKYDRNYSGFAREVLGIEILTDEQLLILDCAEQENFRLAVPSANGVGKTFIAAVATLSFLYTHKLEEDTVVITTAPTNRQVKELLWREINQLHHSSKLHGKCLLQSLTLKPKTFAFGFASDQGQAFQGFHAHNVLLVVDEANGFNEDMRDAVESCVMGKHTGILLIGNPLIPEGWFYEASQDESDYTVVEIDAYNHPNVVEQRTVIPGAITIEKIEEFAFTYGEENPIYTSRVRGKFPEGDNLSTIIASRKTVDEAVNRELPILPEKDKVFKVLSVDTARQGEDYTVLLGVECWLAQDTIWYYKVIYHDRKQRSDVVQDVINIKSTIIEHKWDLCIIDEVGVGGGVIDMLKYGDFPCHVEGFNGTSSPERDDIFLNARAEGYVGVLRKAFTQRRISLNGFAGWAEQLSRLHYGYTMQGAGKIKMLDKKYDPTNKRIVASPDDADTLMMAVWSAEGAYDLLSDYKVTQNPLTFAYIPDV